MGGVALNAGWWLAKAVLDRLGVERAVKAAGRRAGWDIDVASILSLLVCSRVVWPCSKKATTERAAGLLGAPEVDLAQVYPALDHIADLALTLQQAASAGVEHSKASLATVDYDVTNYFFHIDSEDPNARHRLGRKRASSLRPRRRGRSRHPASTGAHSRRVGRFGHAHATSRTEEPAREPRKPAHRRASPATPRPGSSRAPPSRAGPKPSTNSHSATPNDSTKPSNPDHLHRKLDVDAAWAF